MNIYLIRHGRQNSKLCNVDVELSDEGREQAHLVGKRLAKYGIEAVYSSNLIRAKETADIINEYVKKPRFVDERLREAEFGDLTGLENSVLKERYKDDTDVEIQTDFSSNSTVFEADLMITDWSGIAYEYAYTTCKPVLFIDTPMKIMNPEYKKIGIEPLNIWMRYEIGRVLKLDEIDKTADTVAKMLAASDTYKDSIDQFVKEYVYNLGSSASVGAKYIIQEIQKAIKRHKEQE